MIANCNCPFFHRLNAQISVGDKNDTVSVIDFNLKQVIGEFPFGNEVNEIAWSHTSNNILLTTGKGSIEVGVVVVF